MGWLHCMLVPWQPGSSAELYLVHGVLSKQSLVVQRLAKSAIAISLPTRLHTVAVGTANRLWLSYCMYKHASNSS